jgi:hypothetical protein
MDAAELAKQLDAAGNALKAAALAVSGVTPPDGAITTPAELDTALAKADPGATLILAPTLVYPSALALPKPITFRNAAITAGRASLTSAMPSFRAGVSLLASVSWFGIEARHTNPLTDIVVIAGANCVLDGSRVLGDTVNGAKRGIAGNAPNVTVVRCYVDDIKGQTTDPDTQAFCAWDSPGPFLIDDNFLCAGSETILFGGADPSSPANVPANIVVTNNTITKQPGMLKVKNLVEFKNARTYRVENNDLSHCWGPEQGGYAIMITPRNQDGTAPYSEVRNGTIRNNRIAHVGAVLSLLGSDNLQPSGNLDGLVFSGNVCTDVDHVAYNGNDKLYLAQRGPLNVTISGNTVQGPKAGSALYFGEAPNICINFTFQGNTVPPSDYGVMGASCAPGGLNDPHGSAWTTFVQGGTLAGNIEQA